MEIRKECSKVKCDCFLPKISFGSHFFYNAATLCFVLLKYYIHRRKEETLGLGQFAYISF